MQGKTLHQSECTMTNKEVFEIKDKLLAYIKGLNLINPKKLTLDTLIERDLGITGDDAIDFIEEFAHEFNVDITSFDYSKHFGGEGVNMFDVISRLFFREKHVIHADMPLRKLADAIKIRKLD